MAEELITKLAEGGDQAKEICAKRARNDINGDPIETTYAKAVDLANKQDKGDYALKSDIPDVSGLATSQDLSEGLAEKQDKGDYALKSEVPSIEGLATTEQVKAVEDKIPDVSGKQDKLTETQLDNIDAVPDKADKSDLPVIGLNSSDQVETINGKTIAGTGGGSGDSDVAVVYYDLRYGSGKLHEDTPYEDVVALIKAGKTVVCNYREDNGNTHILPMSSGRNPDDLSNIRFSGVNGSLGYTVNLNQHSGWSAGYATSFYTGTPPTYTAGDGISITGSGSTWTVTNTNMVKTDSKDGYDIYDTPAGKIVGKKGTFTTSEGTPQPYIDISGESAHQLNQQHVNKFPVGIMVDGKPVTLDYFYSGWLVGRIDSSEFTGGHLVETIENSELILQWNNPDLVLGSDGRPTGGIYEQNNHSDDLGYFVVISAYVSEYDLPRTAPPVYIGYLGKNWAEWADRKEVVLSRAIIAQTGEFYPDEDPQGKGYGIYIVSQIMGGGTLMVNTTKPAFRIMQIASGTVDDAVAALPPPPDRSKTYVAKSVAGDPQWVEDAGGGSTYTQGDGISITDDVIAVDGTVAKKADIPDVPTYTTIEAE